MMKKRYWTKPKPILTTDQRFRFHNLAIIRQACPDPLLFLCIVGETNNEGF